MGFRVLRERRAHRVGRDVGQRHSRHRSRFAGDEGRDRVEVLAVGLDGVSRRFTGATVGEERGEPLRATRLCGAGGVHHTAQYFMDNGTALRHSDVLTMTG